MYIIPNPKSLKIVNAPINGDSFGKCDLAHL